MFLSKSAQTSGRSVTIKSCVCVISRAIAVVSPAVPTPEPSSKIVRAWGVPTIVRGGSHVHVLGACAYDSTRNADSQIRPAIPYCAISSALSCAHATSSASVLGAWGVMAKASGKLGPMPSCLEREVVWTVRTFGRRRESATPAPSHRSDAS